MNTIKFKIELLMYIIMAEKDAESLVPHMNQPWLVTYC